MTAGSSSPASVEFPASPRRPGSAPTPASASPGGPTSVSEDAPTAEAQGVAGLTANRGARPRPRFDGIVGS